MRDYFIKYFWIATLLFIGASAFLSARLTNAVLAKKFWVSDSADVRHAAGASQPSGRLLLSDYNVIEKRNLFNAHPAPPVRPPPPPQPGGETEETTTKPQPTPLNIKLMGTVIVEKGKSFAVITEKSDFKVVSEGDEVAPGAILQKVYKDKITVKRGSEIEEVLLFGQMKGGRAASPVASAGNRRDRVPVNLRPSPAPSREAPDRSPPGSNGSSNAAPGASIRQISTDSWAIDQSEVDHAKENLNTLLTQIRVVPNFTDGEADGFKVFAIRPGSIFSRIGLQNQDVLKRVNGIEVTSAEQAFEVYQQLSQETSIQLDIIRRNQPKTLNYEIQ